MDRNGRLARNETIFREVNERIEEFTREDEWLDIVCECGNPDCQEPLRVTIAEYERVRQGPTDFLVAPGHAISGIEVIVTGTDRFEVVRKRPGEGELARATDPRG
jgi:hypothetical protein